MSRCILSFAILLTPAIEHEVKVLEQFAATTGYCLAGSIRKVLELVGAERVLTPDAGRVVSAICIAKLSIAELDEEAWHVVDLGGLA